MIFNNDLKLILGIFLYIFVVLLNVLFFFLMCRKVKVKIFLVLYRGELRFLRFLILFGE